MDIYRSMIKPNQSENHYVGIGRITAIISMIIAVCAAKPFLGGFESGFQFVQDFTGFFAPGVVAVFLLGMFFKNSNAAGAFAALIASVALSALFYFIFKDFSFVKRIWAVFLICMTLALIVSTLTKGPEEKQILKIGDVDFATRASFNISTAAIAVCLILLYWVFW